MSDKAPLIQTVATEVGAHTAAADATQPVMTAPFDATITDVSYTPDATITGAGTDTRTISLINKGQDGTSSTVIASLAFLAGVNATAADEKELTLGAPAALEVQDGDVLAFASVHAGAGLADPGGLVQVTLSRT